MNIATRAQNISPSATLAVAALAKQLKAAGHDVMDFGAGEPDFDTPDFIKDAAKAALDAGFTKYTNVSGIVELRQAVADKYRADYGVTYTADQIVISNGGKHSLYNIMQCVINPGDDVLLPVPYWVTYEEQIKLAGGRAVLVPMENLKITAAAVAKHITPNTKAIILNNPSNPTGMMIDRKELEAIGALACKHDFVIVSDDVYEHLLYDGKEFTCIASLSPELYERTIITSAVSKTYSMTGWRIGWTASNKALATAMGNLQSHATSNPCSIAQKGALAALQGSRAFLADWMKSFDVRRHHMVEGLSQCKGISCVLPDGAFYAFPDVSGTGLTGMEFTERLLKEQNVAVVPGAAFGDDRCVRLSYATSMQTIETGLARIQAFCESL